MPGEAGLAPLEESPAETLPPLMESELEEAVPAEVRSEVESLRAELDRIKVQMPQAPSLYFLHFSAIQKQIAFVEFLTQPRCRLSS